MKDGRANLKHIEESTSQNDQQINYALNQWIAAGWVQKITTGDELQAALRDMTENDESTRQNQQESETIEISLSIDDEIVIEDELYRTMFIDEGELERSTGDSVEYYLQHMLDDILREYKHRREITNDGL